MPRKNKSDLSARSAMKNLMAMKQATVEVLHKTAQGGEIPPQTAAPSSLSQRQGTDELNPSGYY